MVDNQHKKIDGYRDMPQDDIDLFNEIKAHQRTFGDLWRRVKAREGTNLRDHALARTHSEDAYYRLLKSVGNPEDPYAEPADG